VSFVEIFGVLQNASDLTRGGFDNLRLAWPFVQTGRFQAYPHRAWWSCQVEVGDPPPLRCLDVLAMTQWALHAVFLSHKLNPWD